MCKTLLLAYGNVFTQCGCISLALAQTGSHSVSALCDPTLLEADVFTLATEIRVLLTKCTGWNALASMTAFQSDEGDFSLCVQRAYSSCCVHNCIQNMAQTQDVKLEVSGEARKPKGMGAPLGFWLATLPARIASSMKANWRYLGGFSSYEATTIHHSKECNSQAVHDAACALKGARLYDL